MMAAGAFNIGSRLPGRWSSRHDHSNAAPGANGKSYAPSTCPTTVIATGDTDLMAGGFPHRDVLNVGVFAGGLLIATADEHLHKQRKLAPRYLQPGLPAHVRLLTQRSANDMFAYGHWHSGRLIRAISVNPVATGV